MKKQLEPRLLAEDFLFLESPRWQRDHILITDVWDKKLYRIDPDGKTTLLHDLPTSPSGIDFLPNGTPVIVSQEDRKIIKLVEGNLAIHADLSHLATYNLNDMLTDDQGRVYVGNWGYDIHAGAPEAPTDIYLIEADGSPRIVASDLEFPNGMAIINGGRTLVVAETWVGRLTAFDRAPSGDLSNRRLFANMKGRQPDGICADASDGIWVGCYNTGEFVRVVDGGEITDGFKCGHHAIACYLGGPDATTLFCCAYTGTDDDLKARRRLAALFTVEVEIPGRTAAR